MEAAITAAAAAAADYLRMAAADGVLVRAAAAALALAEAFCGQRLIERRFDQPVVASPDWQLLDEAPVRAIVAPVDGIALDIDRGGIGWVRAAATGTVSYTAGLAADWATVPAPIAQGVVLLAAHLFEHRDGRGEPPAAVAALWRPYRRLRLATAVQR